MHSSRMRTTRFSGRLFRGGVCPVGEGVCLVGVSARGVSAWGGLPPPRGQTDACENITLPQTSLEDEFPWWQTLPLWTE